jgi:ATP-dependent Clp protease ATP-binding subunit ClpA
MPFSDLQKLVAKFYGAPLSLRKLLPEETRKIYYKNILLATAFVFALSLVSMTIQNMPATNTLGISFFETAGNRIFGIFLILLSISFVFSALEAFHRSYYFKGLGEVLSENSQTDKETVTWEVATVLFETNPKDISGSFANSTYGQEILYRAGVSEKAFAEYENERTPTLTSDGFIVEKDGAVTLSTYAKSIYKQDSEFRNFLSKSNINKDQFIKSAQWVTSIERKERRASRWWSKDNLGRIPGVGKTWDYGVTYYLDRYGHDIINDHIWQTALMTHREEDDEVEELEKILSRNRQSNAMLLTNDVLTARQRVAQLYHKIREGMSLPQIEAKRVFLLDVESIIMSTNEKTNFEKAFVATLNQAVNAGNIILYIENVSVATASAKTIGTDVIDLIQPYFESSDIQIVFAETVKNYNKHLSRDTRISQAFDFIQMKDVEEDGLLKLLEQRSVLHEKMTGIVFTIPALEKIIELADRYFPTGTMPDKAFDLLEEMATNAVVDNKEQILQKDIEEFVTKYTHVPVG